MTTTWDDLLYPGNANDFFSRRTFAPFDPSSGAYDQNNALWLAELSRLVYRHDIEENDPPPHPTQTHILEQAGCTRRQYFGSNITGTQAILAEFGGATPFAVLAFRGTEQEPRDFVTDLTLGRLRQREGKIDVHEGFKAALDSVWREIESALKELRCPVFFTGHSLGAALATLAAARRTPTALYTYGSPRVGDADFTASLKDIADIIHRVVDSEDGVTSLPPEALGYRHIGTLHTLSAPPAHNSFATWLTGWRNPPKFLADHAPVNYVDRI
ncbi:MAG: lipase family protein [Sideroxydans sp.]|nr:lipase family protein [Sideroxydans sp.]